MTGEKKPIETQTLSRAAFTLSPDRPVILTVTTITHTCTHTPGIQSSHAKSFLHIRATAMVISALATSGLSNRSSLCLYMCGQCRPPPQRLNVNNNSLQVMPVVIKVKRLARCRETNLSCWSYYTQIKLSCLRRQGCKLWNSNKNMVVFARNLRRHHAQVWCCVLYSIHSQFSMWRHCGGSILKLFQEHNSSCVLTVWNSLCCVWGAVWNEQYFNCKSGIMDYGWLLVLQKFRDWMPQKNFGWHHKSIDVSRDTFNSIRQLLHSGVTFSIVRTVTFLVIAGW